MNWIIFRNQGVLDTRLITTFGTSVKENDNPIGYFGTGLKYAIAIALRQACEVEIHTAGERHVFTLQEEIIRDKAFKLVAMGGQPLAFTSETGKNWEVWQAYRELYCNALDERGGVESASSIQCGPDETVVAVRGQAFSEAYAARDTIVLATEPFFGDGSVEMHKGENQYAFYHGVRTGSLGAKSMFTYNFTSPMDLTEDRTFANSYAAGYRIAHCVQASTHRGRIKKAVQAEQEWFESDLSYSPYHKVSAEFREVVTKIAKDPSARLSPSAIRACKIETEELLPTAKDLDDIDKRRLRKAVKFLKQLGYNVDDYPIVAVEEIGGGIQGMAIKETIYIADIAFMGGTKVVAGTLLEEFLHLRHKVDDMTRQMQNLLIDMVVTLGERVLGDPI